MTKSQILWIMINAEWQGVDVGRSNRTSEATASTSEHDEQNEHVADDVAPGDAATTASDVDDGNGRIRDGNGYGCHGHECP